MKLMEIGTILVSTWGYGQTNIDFFKVVGKSKSGKSVRIQALGEIVVEQCCSMSEKVIANDVLKGDVMTRRVKTSNFQNEEYQYVGIHSFSTASIWDGQRQFQSHWN